MSRMDQATFENMLERMSPIQLGTPMLSGDRLVASMNAACARDLRVETYKRLVRRFGMERIIRHTLEHVSDATILRHAMEALAHAAGRA